MGIVLEEADETVFWLELLVNTGIMPARRMKDLVTEARQLTAIFVSSLRTAKGVRSA